jgi:DNA polymerase I-like protein with 3'-5' exonuclease and polymerase domains
VITTAVGPIEINWDGVPLSGVVAIDTETELIREDDPTHVPRVALLSATDGRRTLIVPPLQIGDFLRAHDGCVWVLFNAGFDIWVLLRELQSRRDRRTTQLVWGMAARGMVRDAMRLNALVTIGTVGELPKKGTATLEHLAHAYTSIRMDKHADAKYRLHSDQLIGVDLTTVVDAGWFEYAARDALATHALYVNLYGCAMNLVGSYGRAVEAADQTWGLLTEVIQVDAAIALAAIERRGLHVDIRRAKALRKRLSRLISRQTNRLAMMIAQDPVLAAAAATSPKSGGGLFRHSRTGRLQFTQCGSPRRSDKALRAIFEAVLASIGRQTGAPPAATQTPGRAVSTKAEHWRPYRSRHRVVDNWFRLQDLVKLKSLVPGKPRRVHPHYAVLVTTGRTSCSGPNIQQLPRRGGVRELFTAAPGHVLIGVDYHCVELRTLAAICRARFGSSRLADVFADGGDPHAYTAALVLGMSPGQFAALASTDPSRFHAERNKAKAINFGVPGGLGRERLAEYARANYGVEMTADDAAALRARLINDIYPELAHYLDEDKMVALAGNLCCHPDDLWRRLDRSGGRSPGIPGSIVRIVAGNPFNADGTAYDASWTADVWQALRTCCQNNEVAPLLTASHAGDELRDVLTRSPAVTPTGRVRANCTYTEARNAPFQGLAADAAKLALFELERRGFRVVAFVHDEILIEVPTGSDYDAAAQGLRDVMCQQMEFFRLLWGCHGWRLSCVFIGCLACFRRRQC